MDAGIKKRVAWALKCKPEEVPEEPKELTKALDKRRVELKAAKLRKVSNG